MVGLFHFQDHHYPNTTSHFREKGTEIFLPMCWTQRADNVLFWGGVSPGHLAMVSASLLPITVFIPAHGISIVGHIRFFLKKISGHVHSRSLSITVRTWKAWISSYPQMFPMSKPRFYRILVLFFRTTKGLEARVIGSLFFLQQFRLWLPYQWEQGFWKLSAEVRAGGLGNVSL